MAWRDVFANAMRFTRAHGGNVAQIFALALIPLMLAIGLTIDFQRAVVERTYLQKTLDAAALAGGRAYLVNASKPKSSREKLAKDAATNFFNASMAMRGNRIFHPSIAITISKSNEIQTSGTADINMMFGGLVGLNKMAINTKAAAAAGDTRIIEVAMILDNTASMFDGGRFTIMRNAAMNFVDTMFDQTPNPNLVKIGVVPWSVLVNIRSESNQPADSTAYAHANVAIYGSRAIPVASKYSRISNLSWPTNSTPLPASKLKDMFAPVGWRGCIRNAPSEIKTSGNGGVSKPITDGTVPNMRWPVGWVPPELSNQWYKTPACPRPEPERHSEPHPERHSEPHPERHSEPHPERHSEPHPERHSEPHPERHSEPHPERHSEPHPERHFEPHPERHSERHPERHSEPHPESHPKSGPQGLLELPGHNLPHYADLDAKGAVVKAALSSAARMTPWPGPATPEDTQGQTAFLTYVDDRHHHHDDEEDDDEEEGEDGEDKDGGHHKPKPKKCGKWYNSGYLSCWQDPKGWQRNTYIPKTQACSNSNKKPGPTGKVRACVSDPNEFAWLAHGGRICPWQKHILPWTSNVGISGPNLNCPTAMLPLSSNRTQIQKKLEHMYPVPGGTQAYLGLLWGLRTLSPRSAWRSFWGQSGSQAARPWDPKKTRKIAILFTDGENVAPFDYEGALGCNDTQRGSAGPCWKHPGTAKLDKKTLDNLMLATCRAMTNDYKIELYTIAVDIKSGKAIDLLKQCAGDPKRAFNIHSAQLDQTFQAIAQRALRLTK